MKLTKDEFFSMLENGEIRYFSYGGRSFYSNINKSNYKSNDDIIDLALDYLWNDVSENTFNWYSPVLKKHILLELTKENFQRIFNGNYYPAISNQFIRNRIEDIFIENKDNIKERVEQDYNIKTAKKVINILTDVLIKGKKISNIKNKKSQ